MILSLRQFLQPIYFLYQQGTAKITVRLTRIEAKVTMAALAIITGIVANFFLRPFAAALTGVVVLCGLTIYFRILNFNYLKEKQAQQSPFSDRLPKQVESEKKELAFAPLMPFFDTIFKPVIDKVSAKASDPHLCFIKGNTAPFSAWFQNEYKQDQKSIQKNNLIHFKHLCPEVENGLFISIRGDGDCTIRSISAGLILQSLLEHPEPSIEKLFGQFVNIWCKLQAQVDDLSGRIKEMQDYVENLRKQAQHLATTLDQYRLSSGNLNEEGQKVKATMDETREVAEMIEHHVQELQNPKNQELIFRQALKLSSTLDSLKHNLSVHLKEEIDFKSPFSMHLKKKVDFDHMRMKMVELMMDNFFDHHLIVYMRTVSSLNIALNMEKMGSYVKQLKNQEQVVLGNLSVFDLLMRRANARQPNEEYLQGSINEALSLSLLFEQPISWYRCEVAYEPKDQMVYHFEEKKRELHKKHLYVLNRPGHSDLIVV